MCSDIDTQKKWRKKSTCPSKVSYWLSTFQKHIHNDPVGAKNDQFDHLIIFYCYKRLFPFAALKETFNFACWRILSVDKFLIPGCNEPEDLEEQSWYQTGRSWIAKWVNSKERRISSTKLQLLFAWYQGYSFNLIDSLQRKFHLTLFLYYCGLINWFSYQFKWFGNIKIMFCQRRKS
jgi:hypothetical protein